MTRGQSLTQEQIQQLLFPTSYSDSEGEDYDLGLDDSNRLIVVQVIQMMK